MIRLGGVHFFLFEESFGWLAVDDCGRLILSVEDVDAVEAPALPIGMRLGLSSDLEFLCALSKSRLREP